MNNLDAFAKRMNRIAVQVESNVEEAVKDCAEAVTRTVIEATPADTGKAKSNWIVALDVPASTEKSAFIPGFVGSTAEANSQAAIGLGMEVIQKYKVSQNRSINITNSLPYIGALNDGHSTQAPAAFVRIAVLSGLATVRKAKVIKE